jgi:hypothetical protein
MLKMEVSETLTQLPLDFSATMMNNLKIKNEMLVKSEMNNNNSSANSLNMVLQQNNHQQSSSAFKVVTPRKTDGKRIFFALFSSSFFWAQVYFCERDSIQIVSVGEWKLLWWSIKKNDVADM